MKKWIAWLLLGCTLLMAACESTPGTTSGDTSSVLETESSEGTSSDSPMENVKHTLISVGKPYTSSRAPASGYEDLFGQQLTDGQKAFDTAVHYTDVRLVGFNDDARIDIDLGEDGKSITSASVRVIDINTDGVKLAKRVRFYGSNSADSGWESLGKASFVSTGDRTMSTATVEFEEPVDYRYIRASITRDDNAHFFFVDEIEVFADVDEPEVVNTGTSFTTARISTAGHGQVFPPASLPLPLTAPTSPRALPTPSTTAYSISALPKARLCSPMATVPPAASGTRSG